MLDAIIWGLVQGLTEFLPISSSGHLVLVPALLSRAGFDVGDPGLTISAVLHLGTLAAVLFFYRTDLVEMLGFRTDPKARRTIGLLALGSIPAAIGFPLRSSIATFEAVPGRVAVALAVTGAILLVAHRLPTMKGDIAEMSPVDAVLIGVAQAFALIPGISRSGSTIAMGIGRGLERTEAARFSFLMAIPAITAAGILSLSELEVSDGSPSVILVGFIVSGMSGYLAISAFLKLINSVGFFPFAIYCFAVAALALLVL